MDWFESIRPIITGSGVSIGGVLVLFITLLSKGTLWTGKQVDVVVKQKDAEIASKNDDIKFLRESNATERERGDEALSKLADMVPLVRVTNKLLAALPKTEDDDDGS